jgi:hypothetical protein
MNASLLAVLNDTERLLVAETERARLAALDEAGDRALRTPASEKRRASTRAMGARRQARKDSR